jgi:hypothetical protein
LMRAVWIGRRGGLKRSVVWGGEGRWPTSSGCGMEDGGWSLKVLA